MEIKAVLKIDLLGDPSLKQCRGFYEELSVKNWKKIDKEEEKLIVIYNNLHSYEEALEIIKKEISEAASVSGISRYGVLVHFIESSMVVFFCGKNNETDKQEK